AASSWYYVRLRPNGAKSSARTQSIPFIDLRSRGNCVKEQGLKRRFSVDSGVELLSLASPSISDADKDARDSSNIVVIVGTVAGALWFLIGVVLILLLWKRRRDRERETKSGSPSTTTWAGGKPGRLTTRPTSRPYQSRVTSALGQVRRKSVPPPVTVEQTRAILTGSRCTAAQGRAIDAFPNVVTGNCIYNAVPNVQTLKDILRRLLFSKVSCRIHVKSQEYLTSSMIFTDTPLATVYLIL
ncbi:hypothetical protein Bbelb_337180, partial [Branchiostoma belcheri]